METVLAAAAAVKELAVEGEVVQAVAAGAKAQGVVSGG